MSWPRPATPCLTGGALASVLRGLTIGGAFGAESIVGSSPKCKTTSSASWPGYSQWVLTKRKSATVENIQQKQVKFDEEVSVYLTVGCWMWNMKTVCVRPVCWRPVSGRNTPWLDCYGSGLQRSSQSMCCSLEYVGEKTNMNLVCYDWNIRTNTGSRWRHNQKSKPILPF